MFGEVKMFNSCRHQQDQQIQPTIRNLIFTSVAIETAGIWHHQAVELVQEL